MVLALPCTQTPLSIYFFSDENIHSLQEKLRYGVWHMSNKKFVIGRQNEHELSIIMRSIYLQFARNNPTEINEQVIELNKLVLEYAIPNVYAQIKQHVAYKEDVARGRQILDHSVNHSIRGERQLTYNPGF